MQLTIARRRRARADYEQIPAVAERGRARVNIFCPARSRLPITAYVAGEHFTIADISAFITVEFANSAKERCRQTARI